jgi:hypothetical protein
LEIEARAWWSCGSGSRTLHGGCNAGYYQVMRQRSLISKKGKWSEFKGEISKGLGAADMLKITRILHSYY